MAFGDRMLQLTSISFDPSLWNFLEPLLQGASVVLARPGSQRDIPLSGRCDPGVADYDFADGAFPLKAVCLEEPRFMNCHQPEPHLLRRRKHAYYDLPEWISSVA